MINCLIIDDDKKDAQDTKQKVELCFNNLAIDHSIKVSSDPKDILENPFLYDFVFLDIELNESENGIELGKKIKELNRDVHIIITSAYKEYLVDGYRIDADRYLLKPIHQRQFEIDMKGVLDRYFKEEAGFYDETICPSKIMVKNILYVDFQDKHSILVLKNNRKFTTKYPLKYWEEKLTPYRFVRAYKSILVNCDYIEDITKQDVLLIEGIKLPVSRIYRQNLYNQWLKSFQEEI